MLIFLASERGVGGGGARLSEISYTYDPPIYDITSGCRFGVKQQDGRPMLFGVVVVFTHRLTELYIFNAQNVEKVYSRPFKQML